MNIVGHIHGLGMPTVNDQPNSNGRVPAPFFSTMSSPFFLQPLQQQSVPATTHLQHQGSLLHIAIQSNHQPSLTPTYYMQQLQHHQLIQHQQLQIQQQQLQIQQQQLANQQLQSILQGQLVPQRQHPINSNQLALPQRNDNGNIARSPSIPPTNQRAI